MPAGLFGITDDTVNLVVNLLVLLLVVVWLALIAWTFFDARRRIEDPVLVAFATAAALFPYVGSLIYSILRPPEQLDERHERELEIRAAELRLRQLEEGSCPNCERPVERTYLRCPHCRARIKHPCPSCSEPVDPRWSLCPYCETALRRAAPKRKAERPKAAEGERRKTPADAGASASRKAPTDRDRQPRSKERKAAPQERSEQGKTRPSSSSSSSGSSAPRRRTSSSKPRT